MKTVTVHQAKTQFSKIIAEVENGAEVVIARRNAPVAKLVPLTPKPKKRPLGLLEGLISVGPEFFEPLPEDELRLWNGEDE